MLKTTKNAPKDPRLARTPKTPKESNKTDDAELNEEKKAGILKTPVEIPRTQRTPRKNYTEEDTEGKEELKTPKKTQRTPRTPKKRDDDGTDQEESCGMLRTPKKNQRTPRTPMKMEAQEIKSEKLKTPKKTPSDPRNQRTPRTPKKNYDENSDNEEKEEEKEKKVSEKVTNRRSSIERPILRCPTCAKEFKHSGYFKKHIESHKELEDDELDAAEEQEFDAAAAAAADILAADSTMSFAAAAAAMTEPNVADGESEDTEQKISTRKPNRGRSKTPGHGRTPRTPKINSKIADEKTDEEDERKSVERQEKRRNSIDAKPDLSCLFCAKVFKYEGSYHKHLLTHGEKAKSILPTVAASAAAMHPAAVLKHVAKEEDVDELMDAPDATQPAEAAAVVALISDPTEAVATDVTEENIATPKHIRSRSKTPRLSMTPSTPKSAMTPRTSRRVEAAERMDTNWVKNSAVRVEKRSLPDVRPVFTCRTCSREFKFEEAFKKHQKEHDDQEWKEDMDRLKAELELTAAAAAVDSSETAAPVITTPSSTRWKHVATPPTAVERPAAERPAAMAANSPIALSSSGVITQGCYTPSDPRLKRRSAVDESPPAAPAAASETQSAARPSVSPNFPASTETTPTGYRVPSILRRNRSATRPVAEDRTHPAAAAAAAVGAHLDAAVAAVGTEAAAEMQHAQHSAATSAADVVVSSDSHVEHTSSPQNEQPTDTRSACHVPDEVKTLIDSLMDETHFSLALLRSAAPAPNRSRARAYDPSLLNDMPALSRSTDPATSSNSSRNDVDPSMYCKVCAKMFKYPTRYQKHMREHEEQVVEDQERNAAESAAEEAQEAAAAAAAIESEEEYCEESEDECSPLQASSDDYTADYSHPAVFNPYQPYDVAAAAAGDDLHEPAAAAHLQRESHSLSRDLLLNEEDEELREGNWALYEKERQAEEEREEQMEEEEKEKDEENELEEEEIVMEEREKDQEEEEKENEQDDEKENDREEEKEELEENMDNEEKEEKEEVDEEREVEKEGEKKEKSREEQEKEQNNEEEKIEQKVELEQEEEANEEQNIDPNATLPYFGDDVGSDDSFSNLPSYHSTRAQESTVEERTFQSFELTLPDTASGPQRPLVHISIASDCSWEAKVTAALWLLDGNPLPLMENGVAFSGSRVCPNPPMGLSRAFDAPRTSTPIVSSTAEENKAIKDSQTCPAVAADSAEEIEGIGSYELRFEEMPLAGSMEEIEAITPIGSPRPEEEEEIMITRSESLKGDYTSTPIGSPRSEVKEQIDVSPIKDSPTHRSGSLKRELTSSPIGSPSSEEDLPIAYSPNYRPVSKKSKLSEPKADGPCLFCLKSEQKKFGKCPNHERAANGIGPSLMIS